MTSDLNYLNYYGLNLNDIFLKNLPKKPYCTDNLEYGLQIRTVMEAIKKRYIQPNKPTDIGVLVYDVDRSTSHYDWDDRHCPAPNFVVMNKENGHSHLYYILLVPVHQQATAKKNPIRYVAAIDIALTHKLGADINYAKLIAKNPMNEYWVVYTFCEYPYELGELAEYLDLTKLKDGRRRLEGIGLGRNCDLFDWTRRWAYREIRKPVENYLFDTMYRERDFIERCITYACHHNTFKVPLPTRECETIGKSVGRWVYRNMSPAGFIEWCARRGKKSGVVRAKMADDRKIQAIKLLESNPNLTKADIAQALGCSLKTVQRFGVKFCDMRKDNARNFTHSKMDTNHIR